MCGLTNSYPIGVLEKYSPSHYLFGIIAIDFCKLIYTRLPLEPQRKGSQIDLFPDTDREIRAIKLVAVAKEELDNLTHKVVYFMVELRLMGKRVEILVGRVMVERVTNQ